MRGASVYVRVCMCVCVCVCVCFLEYVVQMFEYSIVYGHIYMGVVGVST